MPPPQLWLALAVVVALLVVLWRKRSSATARPPAPESGRDDDARAVWRTVARSVARDFGLQHVTQQALPDRVEGSVRGLAVRLTGTRTRVGKEGASWPVFTLRAAGGEGEAPRVDDLDFAHEVRARGMHEVHRAALRDAPTRAVIRRALALGVRCAEDRIELDHDALPDQSEALRDALGAMLDLGLWLAAPNAPARAEAWRPSPLAALAGRHDAARREGLRAWIEETGRALGPGELVVKQETMEWRGTRGERAFRLCLDDFDELQLEVRRAEPWHHLVLWNDPTLLPAENGADAWDGADEITVFVGRGVYVDGEASEVHADLAAWESLPEALRDAVVEGLRETGARSFNVEDERLRFDWHASPIDLPDPAGVARAALLRLQHLADTLPLGADPTEVPAWTRSSCRFCKTAFVWRAEGECPNCGAPARS